MTAKFTPHQVAKFHLDPGSFEPGAVMVQSLVSKHRPIYGWARDQNTKVPRVFASWAETLAWFKNLHHEGEQPIVTMEDGWLWLESSRFYATAMPAADAVRSMLGETYDPGLPKFQLVWAGPLEGYWAGRISVHPFKDRDFGNTWGFTISAGKGAWSSTISVTGNSLAEVIDSLRKKFQEKQGRSIDLSAATNDPAVRAILKKDVSAALGEARAAEYDAVVLAQAETGTHRVRVTKETRGTTGEVDFWATLMPGGHAVSSFSLNELLVKMKSKGWPAGVMAAVISSPDLKRALADEAKTSLGEAKLKPGRKLPPDHEFHEVEVFNARIGKNAWARLVRYPNRKTGMAADVTGHIAMVETWRFTLRITAHRLVGPLDWESWGVSATEVISRTFGKARERDGADVSPEAVYADPAVRKCIRAEAMAKLGESERPETVELVKFEAGHKIQGDRVNNSFIVRITRESSRSVEGWHHYFYATLTPGSYPTSAQRFTHAASAPTLSALIAKIKDRDRQWAWGNLGAAILDRPEIKKALAGEAHAALESQVLGRAGTGSRIYVGEYGRWRLNIIKYDWTDELKFRATVDMRPGCRSVWGATLTELLGSLRDLWPDIPLTTVMGTDTVRSAIQAEARLRLESYVAGKKGDPIIFTGTVGRRKILHKPPNTPVEWAEIKAEIRRYDWAEDEFRYRMAIEAGGQTMPIWGSTLTQLLQDAKKWQPGLDWDVVMADPRVRAELKASVSRGLGEGIGMHGGVVRFKDTLAPGWTAKIIEYPGALDPFLCCFEFVASPPWSRPARPIEVTAWGATAAAAILAAKAEIKELYGMDVPTDKLRPLMKQSVTRALESI